MALANVPPRQTHAKSGASLDVRVQETDTHVAITAAGSYSLENLYHLLDRARHETETRAKQGVILDMTGVAGMASNLDMHELGTHFGQVWNRAIRLAIVSPPGGVNKFFESVLWTRGVQISVVPSLGDATEWICGNAWS